MIFNLLEIWIKIRKKRNNQNLIKRYWMIDKILAINLEVVHKSRLMLGLMDKILINKLDLKV